MPPTKIWRRFWYNHFCSTIFKSFICSCELVFRVQFLDFRVHNTIAQGILALNEYTFHTSRNMCVCTRIALFVYVTNKKVHILNYIYTIIPPVFERPWIDLLLEKAWTTKVESHSSQRLVQPLFLMCLIAKITPMNLAYKEVWMPKFVAKKPIKDPMWFLNNLPHPEIPRDPLVEPSVLHFIQMYAYVGRFK